MKLFIDANILVSVLNKEYPLFPFTARILSLSDRRRFQLFTSPVCLAIAFYFAEKKHGTAHAKRKIALLQEHISIAGNTLKGVQQTLSNPAINDFEDGLEYYAAVGKGCTCIVTENKKDFYFSEIEVWNSAEFLERYYQK